METQNVFELKAMLHQEDASLIKSKDVYNESILKSLNPKVQIMGIYLFHSWYKKSKVNSYWHQLKKILEPKETKLVCIFAINLVMKPKVTTYPTPNPCPDAF